MAADMPALRELFLRSRREAFVWQPAGAFRLADFDAQTDGERLRVAEDDGGQLAGFVSVWEPDHFIHHLYVHRPHHRRGIGACRPSRWSCRSARWPTGLAASGPIAYRC
ncbi:GNAT family N-acetyltransferase [Burkholderia ambifaria]|uniref:GNAT family N-acetyltransferase n=1 Tax=Burkholderia ambifaria TaxID=152480 RepID=UPI001E2CC139|nr:GNAT family N-acetyltransferase [Burkholderia ambifaria]